MLESGTKKVQIPKPKSGPKASKKRPYHEPTEKHRLAAKLILMGYREYAAMRAVGYSHRVPRSYREPEVFRAAIREALLERASRARHDRL